MAPRTAALLLVAAAAPLRAAAVHQPVWHSLARVQQEQQDLSALDQQEAPGAPFDWQQAAPGAPLDWRAPFDEAAVPATMFGGEQPAYSSGAGPAYSYGAGEAAAAAAAMSQKAWAMGPEEAEVRAQAVHAGAPAAPREKAAPRETAQAAGAGMGGTFVQLSNDCHSPEARMHKNEVRYQHNDAGHGETVRMTAHANFTRAAQFAQNPKYNIVADLNGFQVVNSANSLCGQSQAVIIHVKGLECPVQPGVHPIVMSATPMPGFGGVVHAQLTGSTEEGDQLFCVKMTWHL